MSLLICALLVCMFALPALADAAPAPEATPTETAVPAEAEAAPVEPAAPAPAVEPLTNDTVLAVVNGKDVTYESVKPYYDMMLQQYGSMMDVTDPSVTAMLKEAALNYAVSERVILDKGKELGLDQITEEKRQEIETAADNAYKSAMDSVKGMFTADGVTEEDQIKNAEAYLVSMGYSKDYIRDQMIRSDLYTTTVATITEGVNVTDEQLQKLYDEKVAQAKSMYEATPGQYDSDAMQGGTVYYTPEGVRSVKHILIKMDSAEAQQLKQYQSDLAALPEGDAKRAELEGKIKAIEDVYQPKLDEIQKKIDAGEDFQALIDEYGEDPGMKAGSNYAESGYPISKDSLAYDPPFTAAAMGLEKVGDISAPALGAYGYHFVRYDHDLTPGAISFDAVKDALKESATSERTTELQNEAITQWKEAAGVETYIDRFTE